MEDILIPSLSSPILFHRPALADLPLHHQVEEGGDADHADEKLLDELHDAARRLDDRLCTIERIMTAENPDWRQQCLPGREIPAAAGRRRVSMADDRYPVECSNQPMHVAEQPNYRAAGQPHPLLSRQAQRQDHRRLRRHRRLHRVRRQPGPDLLPRRDVPERRRDPALLFHRRLVTPTKPRASNAATARTSSSGRAFALRRPAPRATSARGSRTSTAGSPTSKAM